MNNQKTLAVERKSFKDDLTIHRKMTGISQRAICAGIGVFENEFHNMLTGFQSSVPKKNIVDWDDFTQKTEAFQNKALGMIKELGISGGKFSKAYILGYKSLADIRGYYGIK